MKFHANFEGVTEFCHIFHFGSLSFNFIITISHQFDHVWNQGDKNFLKKKKKTDISMWKCVCAVAELENKIKRSQDFNCFAT
jgi:hypothetical protein